MTARPDALPLSCPPRGLSRVAAAQYVGISASMLDIMVADGRMPRPKRIGTRVVFDRHSLDAAFAALPDGSDDAAEHNPWDDEEAA